LAMSSDNAQSAVTYTSISSDSDRPSWGIPLMNAGEFPEMDPYEEVAQQGQHAPSDDDIQVEDDDDDPKEDPEEDRIEEHEPENDDEDPEEDPNEEHESKGSDETETFKEDKIAVTPPPSRHRRRESMIHRRDDILVEDMPPRRIFALTGPPPGCDVAERQGLICSPSHDTQTIARAADRAEDASYVRMQESENFYTHLFDAQTDHRDIRLEIDVVRGQRTAYETELQEVHQAYLSFEAQNRELLARLETLKTHMSRMEWQRQSAEDLAVTQMMRIHTLEARART
nr:hypothetical protein [Tanacetum cinerariifolium]